jgi:hypothetical protein
VGIFLWKIEKRTERKAAPRLHFGLTTKAGATQLQSRHIPTDGFRGKNQEEFAKRGAGETDFVFAG